jgi:hypothetical protein
MRQYIKKKSIKKRVKSAISQRFVNNVNEKDKKNQDEIRGKSVIISGFPRKSKVFFGPIIL